MRLVFITREQERSQLLKEAGVKEDPQERRDSIWKIGFPPPEIMALSPAGRRTLELLGNMPKDPKTKSGEPEPAATVAPVPAAQLAIPQPAPETTNEYMAKLNWPPLPSQPPAKDPLDDKTVPHKWQTAKPTPPDKSQRPLPPDLGENEPIY